MSEVDIYKKNKIKRLEARIKELNSVISWESENLDNLNMELEGAEIDLKYLKEN